MNIAKISELVESYYEMKAELDDINGLLEALRESDIQQPYLEGMLPDGKKKKWSIHPDLAKLILRHQASVLRLQIEQIPISIREQTGVNTPRLIAGIYSQQNSQDKHRAERPDNSY